MVDDRRRDTRSRRTADASAPERLRILRLSIDAKECGIWRYRTLSGFDPGIDPVSLHEGHTPLLPLTPDGHWGPAQAVWVKNESANPTWSHKDRLASAGVSVARAQGFDAIITSSTGNQGAAAAAYAARAGLPCVVVTSRAVPPTMQTFMQSYGAYVIVVAEMPDRWELMRACLDRWNWFPLSGYHDPPEGSNRAAIPGYESIAYELINQLDGDIPDVIIVPTAHGDTLGGLWNGFTKIADLTGDTRRPRLIAVEPFGSIEATLTVGADTPVHRAEGSTRAHSIAARTTTPRALHAVRESGGVGIQVGDDAMKLSQQMLAKDTGLFVEPSSAMAFAAIPLLIDRGDIDPNELVIVLSTSSGLKDLPFAQEWLPALPEIRPDPDELIGVLRGYYGVELAD